MAGIIVFLPGIMGSRLSVGEEEVWPPTPRETITGYGRLDKLQSADARPTDILRNVKCFQFYSTILKQIEDLGYSQGGVDKRLIPIAYDWRRDLFDLAEFIADYLDRQIKPDDKLTIVAHSMGGLISRLILESGRFADRAWFGQIEMFCALATPHTGAPLALARVLGLDGAMGISAADFKTLTKNADYPSGYQLLPAPGEDACWDVSKDKRIDVLDIYDAQVARSLGMEPALVERARAVHEAFAAGAPPAHVRYFYFAGTAHKTVSRVNVDNPGAKVPQMTKVQTRGAGDGTVPMWSALPRPTQKHVVVNEHATVFRGASFRNVFAALFGQHIGKLDLERVGDGVPSVSLSQQVYHLADAGEGIEVVVDSSDGISELNAQLVVERITEEQAVDGSFREVTPLAYSGGALRTLVLDLEMPERPGFYQLRLQLVEDGAEAIDLLEEPLPFTVTR